MFLLLMACQSPVEPASYLSVLTISPPHGATHVSTDTEIRAVFSGRLDEGALNVDHVGLEDVSGTELTASFSYDDDTRMLRIEPTAALPADAELTLVLSAGLPALQGGGLPAEVRSSFRTAGQADEPADTGQDTGGGDTADTGL